LNRVADNLYRTGEGTYFARVYFNGKNFKKGLDTHDRQLANRKLANFIKQIESKEAEMPDLFFQDFTVRWLESIKPHLKHTSYRRRLSCVTQLLPFFKGYKLREIKHERLEKWAAARTTVCAQTFNHDRETLHMIYKYALKLKVVTVNPVNEMPKRKSIKAIVTPPTREQFTEMLPFLRANQFSKEAIFFVEFLAYTGMRLSEANQVLWKDIDFKKGLILVTGGEHGTKNNQQRSIPLFAPARGVLERISEGKEMVPTSKVFKHKSATRALITSSEAIGLPKGEYFLHHDMRHFFCSNALENNIPDHVIASWLGHKDGGILVRKTYGHLRAGHSAEMAKLMTFEG
jgi:integrase